MITLIVLGSFGIVQAIFYWFCIRRSWNYVDFAMLGFAIFSNCWLIPKLLMDPHPYEDGCAMSYNGITQGFCYLFGNAISVILFVVYVVVRRARDNKQTS